MKDNCILTAESVTEGHPDKLCDTIADAVVDACLTQDAAARVACEVMATAGKIIAAGEITAAKIPDIPAIICRTVREAGYGGSDYEVEVITHEQSPDIAEAVCGGTETGAGDQGILYGFACDETKELLPLPVVLTHRLTRLLTDTRRQGIIPGLRPDGKAQVSVEYRSGVPYRIAAVVVSCQHEDELPLPELRRDILRHVIRPAMQELPLDEHTEVLVNPSGRFVQGGFEADTGLTGRKLMVDTYGGLAPHGGGALSGKDGTKVDRSGAYMARYIARNIVAAGLAKRCTISLAYAIGKAQPVAVTVDTEHTGIYSDDVLEQAVRPSKRGALVMDTAGYDISSVTSMVAAGCACVIFTTGRGTPTGNAIAPVLKVTANKRTYTHMEDNMDVDLSAIIDGTMTIQESGKMLLDEIVQVCNGKLTKAEAYGFSDIAVDHVCRFV